MHLSSPANTTLNHVVHQLNIVVPDSTRLNHNVNINREGIPPDTVDDILLLKYNVTNEAGYMLRQKFVMRELWLIYTCILVIYILSAASTISGTSSLWYQTLNRSEVDAYEIGALWVISVILSYVSIFLIWSRMIMSDDGYAFKRRTIDLEISVYFLIGAFLLLLWSSIFFQGNNIAMSIWIAAAIFIYHFWLFIYICHIDIRIAILLIPLVIIYGYLFYAMIHLASINNIHV